VIAGSGSATPNMARVYEYWLGGKDHYAADRAEAERLLSICVWTVGIKKLGPAGNPGHYP